MNNCQEAITAMTAGGIPATINVYATKSKSKPSFHSQLGQDTYIEMFTAMKNQTLETESVVRDNVF